MTTWNTTTYDERILREKKYAYSSLQKLNPHLNDDADGDILYHITLGTKSHDLPKMFEDIKYIVLGGTPKRMKQFAHFLLKDFGFELPPGTTLNNISSRSHLYAVFKVGPVLCVSHGTGTPSMGIVLNELIKMVYHARIKDPIFIKIGSCGGVGPSNGDIVITNKVFNEYVDPSYELCILGNKMKFATDVDQTLVDELERFSRDFNFDITTGATFCSDDFYEGSGRSDGCICENTPEERIQFFTSLQNVGIVNTEMESTAFTALTRRAGFKSAIITVVTDDRMRDDGQSLLSNLNDDEWKLKLFKFVSAFMRERLNLGGSRDTVRNVLSAVPEVAPQRDTFQLCRPSMRSSTKFIEAPESSFQYDGLSSYRNFVWSDSERWIHSPSSEFGNWYDEGLATNKTNPTNRYDCLLSESRNEFCSKCGVTLPGKLTNRFGKSSDPEACLELESQPLLDGRGKGSSKSVAADCFDVAPVAIQIKPSLQLSAENITQTNDRCTDTVCPAPSPEQGVADDATNRNHKTAPIRSEGQSSVLTPQKELNHSIYSEYRGMDARVVTENASQSSGNECSDSSSGNVDEEPLNGTNTASGTTPSPFSKETILEKLRQAEFNANRSCNQERKCDAASDIYNKERYLRSVVKKARKSDERETTAMERGTNTNTVQEKDAFLLDQTKCQEESSAASHSEGGGQCPGKFVSSLYCISPPRSKTKLNGEENTQIGPMKSQSAEADYIVRIRNTGNTRDTRNTPAESGLKTFEIHRVSCEKSERSEPESLNLIRRSDSVNSTTSEGARSSCRGVFISRSGGSSRNSWSEREDPHVTEDIHDPQMIAMETSPIAGRDSPNESSTALYCERHTDLMLKIQGTVERNKSNFSSSIGTSKKSAVSVKNVDSPGEDEYAVRCKSEESTRRKEKSRRKRERKLSSEHCKKRKLN